MIEEELMAQDNDNNLSTEHCEGVLEFNTNASVLNAGYNSSTGSLGNYS